MCQASIKAEQTKFLVVLDPFDFIEACNDLISVLMFLFEHLSQEHLQFLMKGDIIKLLNVSCPSVAKVKDTTNNFSLNFIVRICLALIGG